MSVSIQEIPESIVITCNGELNQDAVARFDEAISRARATAHQNIWVDCHGITSVSTAAMRAILSYLGTMDELGLRLVLFNLQPAVQQKLEQAGLTSVLKILPGIREAYLLYKHG